MARIIAVMPLPAGKKSRQEQVRRSLHAEVDTAVFHVGLDLDAGDVADKRGKFAADDRALGFLRKSKLSHVYGEIVERHKCDVSYPCCGFAAIHDRCGSDAGNRTTDDIKILCEVGGK